jgi:hypothetical protein
MILKARYILYRPQPQNPECAHAGFFPFGSRATTAAESNAIPKTQTKKARRKTRLLTNDGMLKILCLDVEELLDNTWSNSLNDVFANCKRRSKCP